MALKNLSPICHAAGAYFADDPRPPSGAGAARSPHRIACRCRDGPRCPRQGGSYDARRERRLYRRAPFLRATRSRAHARGVTAFPVGHLTLVPPPPPRAEEPLLTVSTIKWRSLDYHGIDEATEREHIRLSVKTIRRLTGTRPIGWHSAARSKRYRVLIRFQGRCVRRSGTESLRTLRWREVD